MRKGLSPIISAILILLIAISVTLLAVIWLPKFIINIFPWLGFNESYMRSRGCLSIENVNGLFGLFTIKNCGKVALSDFRFFIDSNFINKLNIGNLEPSQSIDFYDMPITGGRHSLYITADYAESPPYLVDVPYWECIGGEPLLTQDWYVSKNVSCICSYNTIIPISGNVFVIGNGSLSIIRCTLRSHGLFVRNYANFYSYRSTIYFYNPVNYPKFEASGNSTVRMINTTVSQDAEGLWNPFRFIGNSTGYLNYTTCFSVDVADSTKNFYNNSKFSWFNLYSTMHHNLTILDFQMGYNITKYFRADGSDFEVNFIKTDAPYPVFIAGYSSNNTVINSSFHHIFIQSTINQNVNITNFRKTSGTYVKNFIYANGSDFKVNFTNLSGDSWTEFDDSGTVGNNTIYDSYFSTISLRYLMSNYNITNSDFGSTSIYTYDNPSNFSANITNSNIGDLRLGYGWNIPDSNLNITFRNSIFRNLAVYNLNYSNIMGNVTITGIVTDWDDGWNHNSNVTRYFPTVIKDSINSPFPTNQPAVINITNYLNQSVWLGNVSGGSTPINYYIESPYILFNYNNYGLGNFTMKVSQVCENITNITILSNTSIEFTVNKSYNYDGTSFSTQFGVTGLSFDNSNFWVSTTGGTVYKYDKTGGYTGFSFNSGLNPLMDVSSNATYLWLLNYNSTEKRVYRYLPSGTYNNWNFNIPEVLEPYAVDFDGESFWILGNTSVYKYNITGGYVSSFALNRLPGVYYGDIVSSSGNIWILTENYSSSNGRGVFRYKNNGTYDNWYFDIAPTTTTGRGLAFNGTYFWVMNSAGTVFRYSFNRNCLDFMKNCDEFITLLPYTINKNNTRYCLLYNLYVPSQTAITFANNVKNSTLDCQWYNIGGNGVASTVGIYLTGANNNTISNCNINSFDNGIKILSSSNNVITNVNSYSNGAGIVVTLSSNNAVTNCSINGNINNDYYLASLGINNNFINTNFTDYRTIYFYDTTSWFNYRNDILPLNLGKTSIGATQQGAGGRIFGSKFTLTGSATVSKISAYLHTATGSDAAAAIYNDSGGLPGALLAQSNSILLPSNDIWNNFSLNANLLPGDYWLIVRCSSCYFTYDNGGTNQWASKYSSSFPSTFGSIDWWQNWSMSIFATYTPNIWLKTNVSAQSQLTRKLVNWNDALMQWSDTFSNISGSITARYNVTGLVPSAPYSVYDNSFELANSPIKTDSSGALRFTINLPASQEHEIKVVEICDYYLYNSSYLITQSNAYYCLISNVSRLSNSTAINFSSSAQNSTLDCVDNFIRGRSSSYLYGVFSSAYNTTIKNCNITNWRYGFYASNSSYDTLYNNSISGNYYANVNFDSNSNNANIIKNNISAAVWYYGLVASKNNIIINNTIINNPDKDIGIDSNNILINNTIKYSSHGVEIAGSNNTLVNNAIFSYHTPSSRQQGLYIIWGDSKNNISEKNTINGLPILFMDGTARPCVDNTVYTNGSSYGFMGFIGCKNITIRDSSPTDSLYLSSMPNSTVYNLTINFTQRAIQIESSSIVSMNITNNTINGAAYNGIYDHFAYGSIISNNNINCYGGTAGIMIYGGGNDILTNNILTNCSIGFWIYSAGSNNITGGSTHSNIADYGFSGGTANFTNTNFTAARTIQLDAGSWFNYNNETNGNIWLKTNISATATLTRKLLNWNQTFMRWSDNSSSTITARYSISGLLANNLYAVYDNLVISQYSKSNSNGEISFIVYLPQNQGHDIKVQMFYTTPPLWFSNSTNNIVASKPILFSLNWTDDFGLSGFIFRTNNTGTWTNDTWIDFENQTGNAKFIDGFESGGFSAWTGTSVDSGSTLEVIGAAKHSGIYGVHSIQLAWAQNSYTEKDLGVNYGTIYARMYLYPITVNLMSGYGRDYIGIVNEFGTRSSKLQIYNDGGTYKWRLGWYNSSGLWTYALGSQVTTGTWHSIEFKMKHDSSAGEARFYLDGVEDITATGISNPWNCRTVDFGPSTGSGGQSSDTECYFDDVVVSSSYIGPFNSWSNVTKTLNSTVGSNVQWCVYANDSDNNWNMTSCSNPFSLTTTSGNVLNLNFNEANGTKVYDSSGYGNNGTFYGESFNDGISYSGATPTDLHTASGKYGKALQFDGSNDYVSLGSNKFDYSDITVCAWIKTSSPSGNNDQRIVTTGSENTVMNWTLTLNENRYACMSNSTSDHFTACTNSSVNDSSWHYVCGTTNPEKIYLDGLLQSSTHKDFWTFEPNSKIGTKNSTVQFFNGTIDEVRIWYKALNSTEIQAEMQRSLPILRPEASWSFEETGQYANDTHIWVNGTYGSALSFDGSSDYVSIPASESLNITDELTVSVWVYPLINQSTGGSNQIIQRLDWPNNKGFFLREGYNQSHNPQFYVGNGSSWPSANGGSISPNNWYYITGTVKANDKIRIYVDGILKGETNFIGNIVQYTGSVIIGREGSTKAFNGTIDEVRIWKKVLNQTEILAEMCKG